MIEGFRCGSARNFLLNYIYSHEGSIQLHFKLRGTLKNLTLCICAGSNADNAQVKTPILDLSEQLSRSLRHSVAFFFAGIVKWQRLMPIKSDQRAFTRLPPGLKILLPSLFSLYFLLSLQSSCTLSLVLGLSLCFSLPLPVHPQPSSWLLGYSLCLWWTTSWLHRSSFPGRLLPDQNGFALTFAGVMVAAGLKSATSGGSAGSWTLSDTTLARRRLGLRQINQLPLLWSRCFSLLWRICPGTEADRRNGDLEFRLGTDLISLVQRTSLAGWSSPCWSSDSGCQYQPTPGGGVDGGANGTGGGPLGSQNGLLGFPPRLLRVRSALPDIKAQGHQLTQAMIEQAREWKEIASTREMCNEGIGNKYTHKILVFEQCIHNTTNRSTWQW